MSNIAFIGLGIMGKPMAANLMKAGHTLFIYDVVKAPVAELSAKGATACASAKEAAEKAEIVFLMLPDTPDVEAALFGENGVASGVRAGSIVVDIELDLAHRNPEVRRKAGREKGGDARRPRVRRADRGGERDPLDHGRRQAGGIRENQAAF